MADLIVIEYNDMHKAEEVRLMLQKMQRDYLMDMEDAVVAVKDEKGKVKLKKRRQLLFESFLWNWHNALR